MSPTQKKVESVYGRHIISYIQPHILYHITVNTNNVLEILQLLYFIPTASILEKISSGNYK